MLFNSYVFIFLFLPITIFGYFLLNKFKLINIAQAFLLAASLFFYAYFNISYLWLIVFSILFNFTINKMLHKKFSKSIRKLILTIAILANIGLFVYFKYFDFFISNINAIFGTSFILKNLILPLGISFFTFQQISYIIDSYRNEVPNYSFLNYATFVAFFPQLIAGPIVTHDEIVPQFKDVSKKKFNFDNFSKGLYTFAFGLAKKVLIADLFGQVVTAGYTDISGLNSFSAILLSLAYTIQIYFDFSGYCDMATGIGLMFNIKITQNFNSPYRSYSVPEFWQRWHITLTRFFKKYVYFPLGGNRKGKARTYINIFIVFLVSGFWHGANFTFILWGCLHGLANVLAKMFERPLKKLHPAINWILTFVFVNITWIYFRAPTIAEANTIVKKLFSLNFGSIPETMVSSFRPKILINLSSAVQCIYDKLNSVPSLHYMVVFLAVTLFAATCMKNTNERIEIFKPTIWRSVVTVILIVSSIISLSGVSTFLYFNF